jgi:hypothetical protein
MKQHLDGDFNKTCPHKAIEDIFIQTVLNKTPMTHINLLEWSSTRMTKIRKWNGSDIYVDCHKKSLSIEFRDKTGDVITLNFKRKI